MKTKLQRETSLCVCLLLSGTLSMILLHFNGIFPSTLRLHQTSPSCKIKALKLLQRTRHHLKLNIKVIKNFHLKLWNVPQSTLGQLFTPQTWHEYFARRKIPLKRLWWNAVWTQLLTRFHVFSRESLSPERGEHYFRQIQHVIGAAAVLVMSPSISASKAKTSNVIKTDEKPGFQKIIIGGKDSNGFTTWSGFR